MSMTYEEKPVFHESLATLARSPLVAPIRLGNMQQVETTPGLNQFRVDYALGTIAVGLGTSTVGLICSYQGAGSLSELTLLVGKANSEQCLFVGNPAAVSDEYFILSQAPKAITTWYLWNSTTNEPVGSNFMLVAIADQADCILGGQSFLCLTAAKTLRMRIPVGLLLANNYRLNPTYIYFE